MTGYLQVFGDWMGRPVCDHQDGVSLTDHSMTDLDVSGLPVCHSPPHCGHSQLGVVRMIQLSVQTHRDLLQHQHNTSTTHTHTHLQVSLHHLACVESCLLEELQVRQNLTECAPHLQLIDVCVRQNILLLLHTLSTDLHHLHKHSQHHSTALLHLASH